MGSVNGVRLLSPEYCQQLRTLHAARRWGDGGHKYAEAVRGLVSELGTIDVLDYGCGSGTLRQCLPELTIMEFDPGIPGKDVLPSPADVVVCSDVLEHIEPDCLDAVLDHIWWLTRKACFVVISTRPAHTTLPDRRNAHLIVQSVKWWLAQLRNRDWSVELMHRADGDHLIVCCRK